MPCLETSNPSSVTLLNSPPQMDVSPAAVRAPGETAGYLAAREHLQLVGSSSKWPSCPAANLPSLMIALSSAEALPALLSVVRVTVFPRKGAAEDQVMHNLHSPSSTFFPDGFAGLAAGGKCC